jgi:nitrogen regulatory protein P-II 1
MKKLEIIIKPGKLDAVKQAIKSTGYSGITVSQVEGHGNQKGLTQGATNGNGGYRLEMLPKIRLEIVVASSALEAVVESITKAAWTGQPGDGKIFVYDVQDVIRIRTGERGEKAI